MGVIGFSKALAAEQKTNGIKVNVICPGPMDTPMRWASTPDFDRKQIIPPERIADFIVFMTLQPEIYFEEVVVQTHILYDPHF